MQVIQLSEDEFEKVNNKLDRLLQAREEKACQGQLFNNTQVAAMLGVSLRTLQNYRDKGMITFSQIGRKIYYMQGDLEVFINKSKIRCYERKK